MEKNGTAYNCHKKPEKYVLPLTQKKRKQKIKDGKTLTQPRCR